MPCSLNNVQTESINMPVRSGGIEVSAAICRRGLIDLSSRDGPDQYSITLDEDEVGCQHEFRATEHLSDAAARWFPEQPRQHRAGLSINVQRVPRSSSRSTAARCRFRRGERFGYEVPSFEVPSVSCPLLAKAMSPDGTPRSSARCPGGTSSATTSPRSVTNTASPDRTSRMYSLKRFFSSRRPTLFIITM
jgi:hypothetical protein